MVRKVVLSIFLLTSLFIVFSFHQEEITNTYVKYYLQQINAFKQSEQELVQTIKDSKNLNSVQTKMQVQASLQASRNKLKAIDFWLRYLDPLSYKKINGPLPVEWETEVFEKFEKPYKREGAGLTLAYLYLDEEKIEPQELVGLIQKSLDASDSYLHDSITRELNSYHHFYLCNRLFLLNLASIYTTGFECPDAESIIPELQQLLVQTEIIYLKYNESYPETTISKNYLNLYSKAIQFVKNQAQDFNKFNHYCFIKDFVNPLFGLNQEMILKYKVSSRSLVDYSLNKQATSIFSKNLYFGQNPKGIFNRVKDPAVLAQIEAVGKLLFFDPILSGNNERSCASCHNPNTYFTQRDLPSSKAFDHKGFLSRNTPTLLNAQFNHLLMADGSQYTLQMQANAVITNPVEMGGNENEFVEKVLSCKDYKKVFSELIKQTPQETKITKEHVVSAISYYYSKFSQHASPFDLAMNNQIELNESVQTGFNIFMSKAQCATCHFAPHFNGVKPSYVGSEFEVLGVPADTNYSSLSKDKGRYEINPAEETLHAFRTGTLRNIAQTKPYMHNGVFSTLEQVVSFYNNGGGVGHGLQVPNQTLSGDSLHLSREEQVQLIKFMEALTEDIPKETPPIQLPISSNAMYKNRIVGGIY